MKQSLALFALIFQAMSCSIEGTIEPEPINISQRRSIPDPAGDDAFRRCAIDWKLKSPYSVLDDAAKLPDDCQLTSAVSCARAIAYYTLLEHRAGADQAARCNDGVAHEKIKKLKADSLKQSSSACIDHLRRVGGVSESILVQVKASCKNCNTVDDLTVTSGTIGSITPKQGPTGGFVFPSTKSGTLTTPLKPGFEDTSRPRSPNVTAPWPAGTAPK